MRAVTTSRYRPQYPYIGSIFDYGLISGCTGDFCFVPWYNEFLERDNHICYQHFCFGSHLGFPQFDKGFWASTIRIPYTQKFIHDRLFKTKSTHQVYIERKD